MKHTAALFKLNIQNVTENEITVKSVKMTAPTGVAIAGTHTVNLETGAITPSATNGETSRTIVLTLNSPATIAQNGNFTAWIAAAPFVIAKGGSLLFTVTDSENNQYDIIKSFADGHTFASGKIASTTLEINAENKVTTGQEKVVTLDFTVKGNYTKISDTSLLYKSGVYMSHIEATRGCSHNNEFGLVLNSIKKSGHDATITLPQISGYIIKDIILHNSKKGDANTIAELYNIHKQNRCKFRENGDNTDYIAIIQQETIKLGKIGEYGIENDSQYYLKITFGSNTSLGISSMVITYQRM